jgi:hypothetical protein
LAAWKDVARRHPINCTILFVIHRHVRSCAARGWPRPEPIVHHTHTRHARRAHTWHRGASAAAHIGVAAWAQRVAGAARRTPAFSCPEAAARPVCALATSQAQHRSTGPASRLRSRHSIRCRPV